MILVWIFCTDRSSTLTTFAEESRLRARAPNLVQSPPVLVNFRQVTAYLCIMVSKCKTNYTNPLCAALKHLWMKRIILRTIYVIRARITILCGKPGPSLFRQSTPFDRNYYKILFIIDGPS